jgi:dCTP diphosphatase
MANLEDIQKRAIVFRDARDWKQFHNPKDASLSLVLEAAEVMEHFQWKNGKEMDEYVRTNKGEIADELADVLFWIVTMANDLNIDLVDAFEEKMKKNEKKYPIEKARGKHTKYTKL